MDYYDDRFDYPDDDFQDDRMQDEVNFCFWSGFQNYEEVCESIIGFYEEIGNLRRRDGSYAVDGCSGTTWAGQVDDRRCWDQVDSAFMTAIPDDLFDELEEHLDGTGLRLAFLVEDTDDVEYLSVHAQILDDDYLVYEQVGIFDLEIGEIDFWENYLHDVRLFIDPYLAGVPIEDCLA